MKTTIINVNKILHSDLKEGKELIIKKGKKKISPFYNIFNPKYKEIYYCKLNSRITIYDEDISSLETKILFNSKCDRSISSKGSSLFYISTLRIKLIEGSIITIKGDKLYLQKINNTIKNQLKSSVEIMEV